MTVQAIACWFISGSGWHAILCGLDRALGESCIWARLPPEIVPSSREEAVAEVEGEVRADVLAEEEPIVGPHALASPAPTFSEEFLSRESCLAGSQ